MPRAAPIKATTIHAYDFDFSHLLCGACCAGGPPTCTQDGDIDSGGPDKIG